MFTLKLQLWLLSENSTRPGHEKQPTFKGFQEERQREKKSLCFPVWHLFLSVFLKREVSLLDWIKMADLYDSAASEHSALTGAALSERGLSLLLGSVDSFQGLSLTARAHMQRHVWTRRARPVCRHSLARSECCCPSGLCSGPAVTSSLCLCCRWCASSLGYLPFCWLGTSPLFPLPGKWEREKKKWKHMSWRF